MLKYLESVKENDITLNLRRTIASSVGFIDFFPIFNTSEFNEHNSELTFCRYLDRLRKFRVELDYRYRHIFNCSITFLSSSSVNILKSTLCHNSNISSFQDDNLLSRWQDI